MTTSIPFEHSPMTGAQWRVVGLCVMLFALDGFDVLSISFASPGIAQEWGVEKAALGIVLSMELIGMAIGSIVLGKIADQFGRRPVTLFCLFVMTLGMFAAGLATDLTTLSAYRFITGIGIGGILACINAMTAEFSSARYKDMAVILMAAGYPLGVILGGSVASVLLEHYDWRSIFYLGAFFTAAFLIVSWRYLPESVAFLLQRRPANALQRVNKVLSSIEQPPMDKLPAMDVKSPTDRQELFGHDYRRTTLLLTVAYFAHIMTFYFILKWIPKLVVDMGFEPSSAGTILVWANIGGLTGCVLLGLLSRRFPVKHLLLAVFIGSAIMISVFGQGYESLTQLAWVSAATGFFTNAAVVGLYAIFAQCFPPSMRAGGTGFVIGLGRGGAALGPIIGGILFSQGFGLQMVALMMAAGSLVAMVAISLVKKN